MSPIDDLLQRAKRLPVKERRKLIARLQTTLSAKETAKQPAGRPRPQKKRRSAKAALDAFIAMAGTVHTSYTDVSSDKYKHLGEIYADQD